MSNVLVAHGGKHGATEEIARAIADELGKAGHSVQCLCAESVTGLGSCARDHVVFGGRVPLEPANFIERGIARESAPEHRDLRDWDTIRGWAAKVGAELSATNERLTTT